MPESRAAQMIRESFLSGRPLTYIHSPEEQRMVRILQEVSRGSASSAPIDLWTWSLTEGMLRPDGSPQLIAASPRQALDFIVEYPGEAIFHLKDFHDPLRESADVRRRLRDVHDSCRDRRKFAVITSPVRYLPEEIERSVLFLELRPPDLAELIEFVRDETSGLAGGPPDAEVLQQVGRALKGLTLEESRYALRRALAGGGRLGTESLPAVLEEKRLLVNRGGVIEYVDGATEMADVGGLENLKKWLTERRKLFEMRESISAEIIPKGLLMMGIPGCGKSLCVKAISACFQLPLYRVDMVEIFSGRHGKPEGVFVQACHMMEEMAPAVLWFDEIEMGLKTTETGGEQGRIFGFFLTWMQEKTRGLFVAATANRIESLPAEMIRKGRFDEVFFVDLPIEAEQIEIFRIHLTRRGVDVANFNLPQLTQFTVGWTGAEIEQCVISAITRARLEDREVTPRDLIGIAAKLVPLSRTMKEQINNIRGWAFERAIRASPHPVGR